VLRRQDRRGLTTLLFTDIVGSTEVAVELGDGRWRLLQSRHHAQVRRQLKRRGGREVDTAGDGFFATFKSPAEGVRCAAEIVTAVHRLGLEVRAGLHVGETELVGEKVSVIAVTTAARVAALAGPGQVLATETVVHTVAGADIAFSDVGVHDLKGVPGRWRLFSLASVDGLALEPPLDAEDARHRRSQAAPPPAERKTRRAGVIGLAVGALIVAAVVANLFASRPAITAPPSERLPPVGLAELDESSGTITLARDYEGIAIALSASTSPPQSFAWVSGGHSWLPHIWKIDGASGDIVDGSLLHVHRGQYPIAVLGSRLWYAVTTGHHAFNGNPGGAGQGLALVGQGIYDTSKQRISLGKAQGIDDLIVGGRYLWLGDSADGFVYRINTDASTYKRFRIPQAADRLSFGHGRLWILDTRTGSLLAITPNGRRLGQQPVPGDLTDMTVGGGSVLITDAAGDQIQRIPEDLSRAGVPIPLGGVGNGPSVVDYLSTGAVVVGFDDGTAAAFDPTSGAPLWKNMTGVTPNAMTSGDGKVWVVGNPVPNE